MEHMLGKYLIKYNLRIIMRNINLIGLLFIFGCTYQPNGSSYLSKIDNTYFNSDMVAKQLYKSYIKCFKKNPNIYDKNKKNIKYYIEPEGTDGQFWEYKEVPYKSFYKYFPSLDGIIIFYTRKDKILEIIGTNTNAGSQINNTYYSIDNKQIAVDFNKYGPINYAYSIQTSCYRKKGDYSCHAYQRKEKENSVSIQLNKKSIEREVSNLFTNYKSQYKGQSIFTNSSGQVSKKINYISKTIEYYFYKGNKTYMISCNFIYKECKVNNPLSLEQFITPLEVD